MRIGKSAGTYGQGDETPTIIDHGDVSFTTQRVVFQGGKYTWEWLFSNLIGVMHYVDQPWTAIQVSNRQKTSGIVYAGISPDAVRLGLAVAIAICHGESQKVTKELRDELAALNGGAFGRGALRDAAHSDAAHSDAAHSDAAHSDGAPSAGSPENKPPVHPVEAVGDGAGASASAPVSAGLPAPAWAADPTGRHQWRCWDGKAGTDYVADNGQESRDATPVGPP
jgi:hypothetical protein